MDSLSRCLAIEVFEQPTQPLFAANRRQYYVRRIVRRFRLTQPLSTFCWHQDAILLRLVRPQPVIVIDEHRTQMVQMALTEYKEVVEALLPECLDETLDKRRGVG
jgi:hypothetical protein